MSRHRTSLMLAALLSFALPRGASAAPSLVGRAYYDPGLQAVVVPVRGALPRIWQGRLPAVRCAYVDFGAPARFTLVRGQGNAAVAHWVLLARRGFTRLSIVFRGNPSVRVVREPRCGRVVVYLPAPIQSASRPTALALRPPTPPRRPAEARGTYGPMPAAIVPTPLPSRRAALSPAAPTPAQPIAWRLAGNLGLENYSESYLPGNSQVLVPNVPVLGYTLAARLPAAPTPIFMPGLYAAARLWSTSYAFADTNLPLSIHARQEWRGELSATRRIGWPLLYLDAGLGYILRWETAMHSGAPPQPTYIFSSQRIFHGPELLLGGSWIFGQDWPVYLRGTRLYVDGTAAPYVFSQLDRNLPALPPLLAGHVEYGVAHPFGPLVLRLGYQAWWTGSFGGYDELFNGPVIGLGTADGLEATP